VKRVVLLLLLGAGLAFGSVVRASASEPPVPATIPAGVTVGGVAVGGMTTDAAASALETAFDAPLQLVVKRTRVLVSPDVVGATTDEQAAAEAALAAAPDTQLPLAVTVDRTKANAFVATLAKRFDTAPADSKLLLRQMRPFLTKETAGSKLDQKNAVRLIVAALSANSRSDIALTSKAIKPRVTRANFGAVIVIHRGENRLFLYDGMRYWRMFPVATGQVAYPTPLGRFTIVVKWKNPWWYPPASPWAKGDKPIPPGPDNPLGTRWMGLSSPGVGIHGTPSDGSIGYSVSHGCIRMHIPDAEWLFNHVLVGTTVFVVPG